MISLNTYKTIVFIYLFIIQQIISFTIGTFRFNNIYWIAVILAYIYLFFKYSKSIWKESMATFFVLIGLLSEILRLWNGASWMQVVNYGFMFFSGYVGYLYIRNNKINLIVFNWVLIILYIIFIYSYYFELYQVGFDHKLIDGNFFHHSSSNAVSMSLCIVLIFYLLLNSHYQANREKDIFIFSLINASFCVVQGSRAASIVSFLIILCSLYSFMLNNKITTIQKQVNRIKRIRIKFLLLITTITLIIIKLLPYIAKYYDDVEGKTDSYVFSNEARFTFQNAFFRKMSVYDFIFGFPTYTDYDGKERTFNAFLDFWARFGLIAVLFFLPLFLRRILYRRNYSIPIYSFIPLFVYSCTETIWGGTLWDSLIFIYFFLHYPTDVKFFKKNSSIHSRKKAAENSEES